MNNITNQLVTFGLVSLSVCIPTLIIFSILFVLSKFLLVDPNKPASKRLLLGLSLCFYFLIGIVLFYFSYLEYSTGSLDYPVLEYFTSNPLRLIWPVSVMIGM